MTSSSASSPILKISRQGPDSSAFAGQAAPQLEDRRANTYKIDGIGAAGVGDKIYLAITQELSPWHSDGDADTRNRILIHDFTTAVPEYSASFSGLILLARDESGGHLYRTVATYQRTGQPAKK